MCTASSHRILNTAPKFFYKKYGQWVNRKRTSTLRLRLQNGFEEVFAPVTTG